MSDDKMDRALHEQLVALATGRAFIMGQIAQHVAGAAKITLTAADERGQWFEFEHPSRGAFRLTITPAGASAPEVHSGPWFVRDVDVQLNADEVGTPTESKQRVNVRGVTRTRLAKEDVTLILQDRDGHRASVPLTAQTLVPPDEPFID